MSGRDDYTPRAKESFMARPKTVVNERMLRGAIRAAEMIRWNNQASMWAFASVEFEKRGGACLSPDMVRKRAIEFGIKIKTPRGVRGKKATND